MTAPNHNRCRAW